MGGVLRPIKEPDRPHSRQTSPAHNQGNKAGLPLERTLESAVFYFSGEPRERIVPTGSRVGQDRSEAVPREGRSSGLDWVLEGSPHGDDSTLRPRGLAECEPANHLTPSFPGTLHLRR